MITNSAHAQFVPRTASLARKETQAPSAEHAQRLMELPQGESILAYRDRAILKTYVYTGLRLGTGCRWRVRNLTPDAASNATLRLREDSDDSDRVIGVHAAAEAIAAFIERADLKSGPLFHARKQSRTEALAKRAMNEPRCIAPSMATCVSYQTRCNPSSSLGHRYVAATQLYDERKRPPSKNASHDMPI